MQGWVKLHRSIMESSTFRKLNAIQQLITIYIILNANHEDGVWYDKYKDIEVPVKRGQLITSRNKIANEWFAGEKDITERKVRTTLERLEKYGFLTKQTTSGYTLLTINNYGVYQSKGNENDQANDHEPTRHRPSDDQAMTTNKNDKNVKNDKELCSSSNSDPKFSEVMKFYQDNLQRGITESPFNLDLINQWYSEWGHDLMLASMKVAAKAEAKGVSMIEGILKNWKEAGVKTMDDARKFEKEFKERGKKPNKNNNVVPIKNRESQYDDYDYGF